MLKGCNFHLDKWGYAHRARSTIKIDRNFDNWLERIEFHFAVSNCPPVNKTGLLILLLYFECLKVAKYLVLKSTTGFDDTKAKLIDYFAITETSKELRKRLALCRQEAGESIETFAPDVKLIRHGAYLKAANSAMLEHIVIKQFVNSLNNEMLRERVIRKAPKILTEVAQFAQFSE